MDIALNSLEIRILLKCNKGLLERTYISSLYARHTLKERKEAINHLIEKNYILAKELPLPDAKVAPVYYEITEEGKMWIKEYLESHPKYRKKT